MAPALSNRIRFLRDAKGWSMEALGKACRPPTSASTINKLEKGHVQLTTLWMRKLAAALDVHPNDLLDSEPQLSPKEAALVDIYRGPSDEDQSAVFRVADAISQQTTKAVRRKT